MIDVSEALSDGLINHGQRAPPINITSKTLKNIKTNLSLSQFNRMLFIVMKYVEFQILAKMEFSPFHKMALLPSGKIIYHWKSR